MRTFGWDTAQGVGMPFESAAEAAANGALTDIVEINCRGRGGSLVFEVQNLDGAVALQNFALLAKAHENGDWQTLVSGTDWSAATASGPNTLAAASRAMVSVSIAPAWSIKFQARAASATVSTVVRGTLNDANAPTAAAIAAALVAATPAAKTITILTKAVTTAGTGVALVAAETFARKVWLNARKAAGANTGLVFLGTSAVDKDASQQMVLAPGDAIVIEAPFGTKIDLATLYIDCETGNTDGVTGWYMPV